MSVNWLPILLLHLALAALPLYGQSWEEALDTAVLPARQISGSPFLDAFRDLLDATEEQQTGNPLPSPELVPEAGLDLQKIVRLEIPELSARQALEYLARRSGFQLTIEANRFTLRPGNTRNPEIIRDIERNLSLQQLLFNQLREDFAALEPDLADYAENLLRKAKILRLGPSPSGRVPPEYAAAVLLARQTDGITRLRRALPEAGPVGYFYFAGGLMSLGETPAPPDFETAIPVLVEGGNLIILESAEVLYREQILQGALFQSINRALAAGNP